MEIKTGSRKEKTHSSAKCEQQLCKKTKKAPSQNTQNENITDGKHQALLHVLAFTPRHTLMVSLKELNN